MLLRTMTTGSLGICFIERCRSARTSLRRFEAMKLESRELFFPVPDKAGAAFGPALQCIDASQTLDGTNTQIAAFEPTKMEFLVKLRIPQDHERCRADDNRRLEHHVVIHNVNNEYQKAHVSTDKTAVPDANGDCNVKDALPGLNEPALADKWFMLSAFEDSNSAKDQLSTMYGG